MICFGFTALNVFVRSLLFVVVFERFCTYAARPTPHNQLLSDSSDSMTRLRAASTIVLLYRSATPFCSVVSGTMYSQLILLMVQKCAKLLLKKAFLLSDRSIRCLSHSATYSLQLWQSLIFVIRELHTRSRTLCVNERDRYLNSFLSDGAIGPTTSLKSFSHFFEALFSFRFRTGNFRNSG